MGTYIMVGHCIFLFISLINLFHVLPISVTKVYSNKLTTKVKKSHPHLKACHCSNICNISENRERKQANIGMTVDKGGTY